MGKRLAAIAYSQIYTDVRVIREAKAAVEAGYEVEIYSLQDEPTESFDGITVFMLPSRKYKGSSKLMFLFNYIRFFLFCFWNITFKHLKVNYNIIHVHNIPNFFVFACIIPKISGTKIILDIHDIMPELFAEKFQRTLDSTWIKALYLEERLAGNFADAVISTNRLISRRLASNGINKSAFAEILNAADESMFPPIEDVDFSKKPVQIIFPSTIARRLGLDTLIDAIRILKNGNIPVQLNIFGMGEYSEKVRKRILDEDLTAQIRFPGRIYFDELNRELEKSQIGVLPWPSSFSTNFQMPIKVHEYFIKGLCVIAADVNIVKEYFSDEVILFEAGNAQDLASKIAMAVSEPEIMKEYARRGHEYAQKHSWEKYKKRYMVLLEELQSATA